MLGNLAIFAITWALLRFHSKGLAAIGLDRPRRRVTEFAGGFAIYGLLQLVRLLVWAPVTNFSWVTTETYSLEAFAQALYSLTQSVLYEELLFRGYLLWLAIQYLGKNRAVALSAATFGIYHWFSYGILVSGSL